MKLSVAVVASGKRGGHMGRALKINQKVPRVLSQRELAPVEE